MGRRLRRPHSKLSHEFELDLAPLLAVMVKLVPVLLLSSAFVQVMTIETDLPQAVKEAIAQNNDHPKATVQLEISNKSGIKVIVGTPGAQPQIKQVVPAAAGKFDYQVLHKALQAVKTEHPEVFRIELAPESDVPYKEIVKIMDEARKSHDKTVNFPLINPKELKATGTTDYMFPDVIFSNMMDG